MISLTLRKALSMAGINPHSAPPTKPAISISGSKAQAEIPGAICGTKSATPEAAKAPMANCPSAPMFQNSMRKATDTARPVSISGVARTSVSLTA
jgi:hypothetical protein